MPLANEAAKTHHNLISVSGFPGSKARWATQGGDKLILFVHGFSGGSVSTWKGFEMLLPLDPQSEGVDLFFYGYDTFFADIRTASSRLFELLKALNVNRGSLMPTADKISVVPAYRVIVICAHSLGGVVLRRALLDAYGQKIVWNQKIGMILFAPAHLAVSRRAEVWLGTKVSTAVKELLDGFSLHDLRHKTEKTQSLSVPDFLAPKAVVQAEKETWVMVGAYAHDPPCVMIPGATHRSICKPKIGFMQPVEIVLSVLRDLGG